MPEASSFPGIRTAVSYFSSMEKVSTLTARAAELVFTQEGGGVQVDFSQADAKILPYREGEELRIRFSTAYTGSTAAYALPRFVVSAAGLAPEDRIAIRVLDAAGRETASGRLSASGGAEAMAELFGKAERFVPGDSHEYELVLFMEKLSEQSIPLFDYDFALAAVQCDGNEELMEGDASDAEKYREAEARAKGEASSANGFAQLTDLSEAVDQHGDPLSKEAAVPHLLHFRPGIGETDGLNFCWYLKSGSECIPLTESKDGALKLTVTKRQCPKEFYLEARNQAGMLRSAVYCLESVGKASIVMREEGEQ